MEEIWKDIEGYEGLYQVSNLGRIKRLASVVCHSNGVCRTVKEKIRKIGYSGARYGCVILSKNGIHKTHHVHQEVAKAFLQYIPNRTTSVINHIDGDKRNNRVDNLEIVTQSDNVQHSIKNGLFTNISENAYNAAFSLEQVLTIRDAWKNGELISELARKYKVSSACISRVVYNKCYYDEIWQQEYPIYKRTRSKNLSKKKCSLSWDEIRHIREEYKCGKGATFLSKKHSISLSHMNKILSNKAYYDENYIYKPHCPRQKRNRE